MQTAKALSRKELKDYVQDARKRNQIVDQGNTERKEPVQLIDVIKDDEAPRDFGGGNFPFMSKSEPLNAQNQNEFISIEPGCNNNTPTTVASERKLKVMIEVTPEEYVILTKVYEKWKNENPKDRKHEEILLHFCREFLVQGQPEKNNGDMVIVDSPYQVVINHCAECGSNTITIDKGIVEVEEAVAKKAMVDGKVLKIDGNGKAGRNGRSISTALRNKVILRDHVIFLTCLQL